MVMAMKGGEMRYRFMIDVTEMPPPAFYFSHRCVPPGIPMDTCNRNKRLILTAVSVFVR
jgi:hypothetical protein